MNPGPRAATIALSWRPSANNGWGLCGIHIALALLARGRQPLFLREPLAEQLGPDLTRRLAPVFLPARQIEAAITAAAARGDTAALAVDLIQGLGNGVQSDPKVAHVRGRRTIGFFAFEDTAFDAAAVARARTLDFIIVHSTYNARLLRQLGIDARLAFQGVDPALFRPLPRRGRFAGRFTVFSGGKVEFRKGQDLVLAAFRAFHLRHPEAVLVTAWQSPWPGVAADMAQSARVDGPPKLVARRLDVTGWAVRQGLTADSVIDLGLIAHADLPAILAECDAALFPNRCEGATNLVAMEAMACGVPTILSANTGHGDIIRDGGCWPLLHQNPVVDPTGCRTGWGESDPDEALAYLEEIWCDPAAARHKALTGSNWLRRDRRWDRFAAMVVGLVDGATGGDISRADKPL